MERKGVRVEVWPMVADEEGIWLVSGAEAWQSEYLGPYVRAYDEVGHEIAKHQVPPPKFVHSTSWREDESLNAIIVTYMAGLDNEAAGGRELPRGASRVPVTAFKKLGDPIPVGAGDEPKPRNIDILFHGLRHLNFLLSTDAAMRDALRGHWEQHLAILEPAFAGMYDPARRGTTFNTAGLEDG